MSRVIRYKEHDEAGNIVPGLMRCDCGAELDMERPGADIHCACGLSYNSAGQQLAHRSQWGEETGETAEDYDRGFADPERAFNEDI